MIYPSLSSLLEKADSRFTLAVATAKRARQIIDGDQVLTECDSEKAVTIALHEINDNWITYTRTKSGIK
jgi:DNA-directed RNA polymerase subunit omega